MQSNCNIGVGYMLCRGYLMGNLVSRSDPYKAGIVAAETPSSPGV